MPQNFISRYNNLLAVKGLGSIEYTAGPNIDISDYVISGRDWTSDIDSAIEGVKGSGFSAATAWVDSQGYLTAHQDVDNLPYVQNSALEFYGVQISGISGSGLYATSAENAFTAETANYALYSEEAGSAASAATAEYSMSATSAHSAQYAQSANSALGSQTALISMFALSSQSAGLITEGWDYTDPENSAISGLISGYNGSAFYDLGGDDSNCPWISGNKVIGAITADFGNTVQVISSFDFSGNKNHYISLKGFNLTLPSTGGIASALDQKFDTSSFNTFIENGFNPNMTELHGATGYISAFVNTGCVHNSALDPTIYNMFSGISGSGFYATSAQNAFTAETANWAENAGYIADGWEYNGNNEITGYSGSAFASEGGDTTPWISGDKVIDPELLLDFGDAVQMISSFNVSGYKNHAIALKGRQLKLPSTAHIQSALDEKLDTSAFTAYSSQVESDKLDTSAFTAYTATVDPDPYSGGANIDITDHVVSGKDWSDEITAASSYAYSQATADAPGGIEYTGVEPIVVNNSEHKISANTTTLIAGIGVEFATTTTSTTINVTGGGGGTGNYVLVDEINCSIGSGNSVTGANSNTIYRSGNFAQGADNSAIGTCLAQGSANDASDRSFAQGSLNKSYLNSFTQGRANSATTNSIAQGSGNSAFSNSQAFGELNSATAMSFAAGSANTAVNTAFVHGIGNSAKTHSVAIGELNTAYNYGYILGSANSAVMTGVALGDRNTAAWGGYALGSDLAIQGGVAVGSKNKISADAAFVVGNGVSVRSDAFVIYKDGRVSAAGKMSANGVELGAGGGGMNVTDGTSAYSALGFYDQVADTGCFQIMGTANGGTTPGVSFGYTLPMQARNFSADTVASAKNYTDDEISAHIKYVSYGALVGGTVTFADVRSAIVNGGIVIPYEVKLPGNNYFVYNYSKSGIDNLTTGYEFSRYDAGGNCVTLTVSSYNDGATTGCVTGLEKVFVTPNDIAAVDRIVLVAASGDIPASGATDNKVYIVTGS